MASETHVEPGESMRWSAVWVATLLITVGLVSASPAAATHCVNVNLEPIPPYTPPEEIGDLRLCDTNSDSRPDTVEFETRPVTTQGEVTLAREQHVTPTSNKETTQAEVLVYAGLPTEPTVYNSFHAEDRDNDEIFNRIETRGGIWYQSPFGSEAEHYRLGLMDIDNDGLIDAYALLVCVLDAGCSAPGPEDLPEPEDLPGQNDLPEPVFKLPIVGWIP